MAEETQSITTRHDAETDPALWWRQAVVYQVYPRSFQDTTGSGLGDINGITGRIPYLRQLGVDAIWLSPFYPSELADGGYDVADYRDVDPKLGSMDDFDRLAAAAHAADIKVVVDIVPNHSSHLHPWFRQALADLKDRYPQRLQVVHLFSQESMDSDLLQGRIDGEKLHALSVRLLDFSRFDEAFICGPAVMMDEAETALRELGMAENRIHLERFNTPGSSVKRATGVQAEGRTVTIRQDGRDRQIALTAEDDSSLDAALRQGADLPFACKGGVCATCKCKVLRGEVAMAANYSLEADELAAGYVLSCQALPTSGDVVVDFDARGMA